MRHVDDFIDDPKSDPYASLFFELARTPAVLQMKLLHIMDRHKLFCQHETKTYRVTGCSRMGDVWLTSEFEQSTGYELRVDIDTCGRWSKEPVK